MHSQQQQQQQQQSSASSTTAHSYYPSPCQSSASKSRSRSTTVGSVADQSSTTVAQDVSRDDNQHETGRLQSGASKPVRPTLYSYTSFEHQFGLEAPRTPEGSPPRHSTWWTRQGTMALEEPCSSKTTTTTATTMTVDDPVDDDPQQFPPIEPGASLMLAWQIKNKRVLLIGGGQVAAGRLYSLLNANAKVTLISPSSNLSKEVKHRINDVQLKHVLEYKDRLFQGQQDLENVDMCLTAIDDSQLSTEICKMCRQLKIPVNVADVPTECDFYFGSIVRRGPLQVMVSTGGKGPRIANRIKRMIEQSLPDNVGPAIDNVGLLRQHLRKIAGGKDKQTIDKRMDWMIRVCDKWSLDQLSQMDDRMRHEVLQGWTDNDGQAKSFNDVNSGVVGKLVERVGLDKCPARDIHDGRASRCPFVLMSSGFMLGVATASVVAVVLGRKWR
ncbi:Bifunctional dehydrogenase and ferrochelatase [Microbotryomycetes sp. JL221]|nr:Bifunctional dehydrogenase and ferrochelatase [Microbotryomycetes sp. JL221]